MSDWPFSSCQILLSVLAQQVKSLSQLDHMVSLEHQHTLRTMGHQARQHVLERFSEQQVIERLGAVYQRCYQLNEDKKATALTESST